MAKSDIRETLVEQAQAQAEADTENKTEEQASDSAAQADTQEQAQDAAEQAQEQPTAADTKVSLVLNPDFNAVDGSVRVSVPNYEDVELTEKPVELDSDHAALVLESPAAKRAAS